MRAQQCAHTANMRAMATKVMEVHSRPLGKLGWQTGVVCTLCACVSLSCQTNIWPAIKAWCDITERVKQTNTSSSRLKAVRHSSLLWAPCGAVWETAGIIYKQQGRSWFVNNRLQHYYNYYLFIFLQFQEVLQPRSCFRKSSGCPEIKANKHNIWNPSLCRGLGSIVHWINGWCCVAVCAGSVRENYSSHVGVVFSDI